MRAAVLQRFRDALAGEAAFLAVVDAATPTADCRTALADWACRTVTALALDGAGASTAAAAVRTAPPVTLATAADWEQRLSELIERTAR